MFCFVAFNKNGSQCGRTTHIMAKNIEKTLERRSYASNISEEQYKRITRNKEIALIKLRETLKKQEGIIGKTNETMQKTLMAVKNQEEVLKKEELL